MATDDLAALLDSAARGVFPRPDGSLRVLPPAPDGPEAVLAFSGAHVVVTTASESEVRRRMPPGDLGAPLSADVLGWFAQRSQRHCDNVDAVLAALPVEGGSDVELTPVAPDYPHPRVARSRRHRQDVRVFRDRGGRAVVVLGRGLGGRWEVSFEIDRGYRGTGLGSALAHAARAVVPDSAPLFAQVAPGNASSLRAVLSAGYRPIGAEALFY